MPFHELTEQLVAYCEETETLGRRIALAMQELAGEQIGTFRQIEQQAQARQFSLPMHLRVAQAINPQTTNATVTSQVINCKTAHKMWFVLEFTNAAGFASVPTLNQATTLAAGTNKAGPAVTIFANENTATNDTLVRQASFANSYTTNASISNKEVIFEVDPSLLDVNNGYSFVYLTMATSSQATNLVSGTAFLLERYQQLNPPTAVA